MEKKSRVEAVYKTLLERDIYIFSDPKDIIAELKHKVKEEGT